MTAQTSRAATVPKVMAWLMSAARCDSVFSSAWMRSAGSGAADDRCPCRARLRSMTRDSRLVRTASRAAMPEKRKTGATASWMAWATPVIPAPSCIGQPSVVERRRNRATLAPMLPAAGIEQTSPPRQGGS